MSIKKFYLFLFIFPIFVTKIWATHNRAGEITVRQISALRVEITITTYTKASSVPADRDTLELNFGDGTPPMGVRRTNGGGGGEFLPNDTKKNLYVTEHNYPGLGTYLISMTDPNRNGGILNVNAPNSESVPFHLETSYTLLSSQFQGRNSTPILLQPPIDIGCVGQRFIHNPNAYDVDGDSLAYELITPLQSVGLVVPNYVYPNQIFAGPNNIINLNPVTGDFIWDAPQKAGEYNIAMYIIEYRNGVAIDTMIRDMQILIKSCNNRPPTIKTKDEICVVAGDTVRFNVIANDPDPQQKVILSALGGPFIVAISPAKFLVNPNYQVPPDTGRFVWATTCEHISDQPYSVVFKATDNFLDTTGLSTLKTVRIKVVGPPPLDVQAKAGLNQVEVTWQNPYKCQSPAVNYFWGFSVWRKLESNPFVPDTCKNGLAGRGYTEIEPRTTEIVNGKYYFKDVDVERGRTYCYRVLAGFARRSASNQPYNYVESLPSNEACVQLSRDLPLLTKASVLTTDLANGRIEVNWTKPLPQDLDTILNPPPYRLQVFRANGITAAGMTEVAGASFSSSTFAGLNDTIFIDNNLNTEAQPYSYKIAFYVRGDAQPLGFSEVGSSVFLNVASTDQRNNLSWQFDVPWQNTKYIIFRKNDATGIFDSIGFALQPFYADKNLNNGQKYCYKIQSIGSYGIPNVVNPILNFSQESCGIPLDTVPPCPPRLRVFNVCNPSIYAIKELENLLHWTNPNEVCAGNQGVARYKVYFSPSAAQPLTLLFTIEGASDTAFLHRPSENGIAGCYAVSALDTLGNESPKSNTVCVDNCPLYKLPNAFTPNNDGQNDKFKPYPYRFIQKIDLKIFNRWGELVFQTSDPDINWDGKNLQGKELAESAYFYTCQVFEQRLGGSTSVAPQLLSGYIELIRGTNK